MGLNAKKVQGNGGNRTKQPVLQAGVYPGRLVQLIDLGLQPQRAYQGKEKPPAQELMLTYELVDEFLKDDEGVDIEDKPRWISETLPFYGLIADKAKSTQRYNALDPSGDFDGDFSLAVGNPINITIVHNPNPQDPENPYQNVANIAAMRPRDAEKCPPLKNAPKVFDLDAPDMEVFNALPDWIQKKIKGNLKFAGSLLEEALKAAPAAKKVEEKKPEAVKKNRQPAPEPEQDENPY